MPEDAARPALDMMNYGMYVIGSRGPMGLNVMAAPEAVLPDHSSGIMIGRQ